MPSVDACNHPDNQRIEDRHGGNIICAACGYCFRDIMFDDRPTYHEQNQYGAAATGSMEPERSDPLPPLVEQKLPRSRKLIKRIVDAMKLPEFIEVRAREIHKDALVARHADKGIRGKNFYASCASAVYYACKIEGIARGETEFQANTDLSLDLISSANKLVRRALANASYAEHLQTPIDARQMVPRFLAVMAQAPALIPPAKVQFIRSRVEEILGKAEVQYRMEGKTPECVCCGAIAAVMQEEIPAYAPDIDKKNNRNSPLAVEHVISRCHLSESAVLISLNILKGGVD